MTAINLKPSPRVQTTGKHRISGRNGRERFSAKVQYVSARSAVVTLTPPASVVDPSASTVARLEP